MSNSHPLSLSQQLAQRAKTWCFNLGLKQSTLAALLRIDDSQMSRFLRGEANLSSERTLQLARLLSLNRRDLQLKFGEPEKLSARLMHLQESGRELAKVVHFAAPNDGWVSGQSGTDPNDSGDDITSVNNNPARSVPDAAELEFLAGLAGLHQQIIDKINNWQTQQKARPNPNGANQPARQTARPKTPGPRGDLLP